MSAAPPASRPLARLARLLIGSNALRRPVDRIEGAVIATLLTAFIAAVTVAFFVGADTYQSERAAGISLGRAVAVLTQSGPIAGQVQARWPVPNGQERTGLLTAVVAPAIEDARRGSRVRIWITRSGDPAGAPPSEVTMVMSAIGIPVWLVIGVGGFLMFCYWPARLILDKRRLAGWESAWARVGPSWTTRR